MKKNGFKNVLLSFGIVIIVAGLGSLFVALGSKWFAQLAKPSQWIVNFIIPIVWSVIYSISAVVIFLLLDKNKMQKQTAILFGINGILNVLWCLLFFTLRLTFVGQIAIVLNLIASWFLVFDVKKQNTNYFYVMLIYPIWLCLATSLNFAVWVLN